MRPATLWRNTVFAMGLAAVGCAADDSPPLATAPQALLDPNAAIDGTSSSNAMNALRLGQFAARTPEFANCVLSPRPDVGLAGTPGASRAYRACAGSESCDSTNPCFSDGDCSGGSCIPFVRWCANDYCPDAAAGRSSSVLLKAALNTNHTIIHNTELSGAGTRGSSCYNMSCQANFPGGLFDEEMWLDQNFINNNFAAAAQPFPWNNGPFHPAVVSGTIWHEAMHNHRYSHGHNTNQGTASIKCGFSPSDATWDWQRNAGTAVVQGCIENLLTGFPGVQIAGNPCGRGPFGARTVATTGSCSSSTPAYRYIGDNIVDKYTRDYLNSPTVSPGPYPILYSNAYARMMAGGYGPDDLASRRRTRRATFELDAIHRRRHCRLQWHRRSRRRSASGLHRAGHYSRIGNRQGPHQ